jgi:uncharacterized phage protein (TIGR01671 family)
MNREIKFRTFIDEEMVFLPLAALQYFDFEGSYALSFVVDGYEGFFAHENYDSKDITKRCNEAPIMQFTGLKDKNGVDIYEGDIIDCNEYDSNECLTKIINNFPNAVVGYYKGCFWYYPKGNMKCPHQLLIYAYKAKVIGNIYQNPELLNK